MDMHENNIKNAVNGIAYSEDTRTRIWEEISQKNEVVEKDVRKRIGSGKMKAAIVLACAAILLVIVNVRNGSQYGTQISVYAKNPDGGEERIVLSPGEQVELQPVETPDGYYGYVVGVDLQNADYTYEITPAQESETSFTIYQEGEYIYWTPERYIDDDGQTQVSYIFAADSDKVRTDDGSFVMDSEVEVDVAPSATYQYFQMDGKDVWINSEYVDNEEVKIIIYDALHEISEEKTIRFENSDEGCSVVLTE